MKNNLVQIGRFKYLKIPISEIEFPACGYVCYPESYWLITDDNCVIFYNGISPQCNTNYKIAKMISDKGTKLEVKLLPIVYLKNEWLGGE